MINRYLKLEQVNVSQSLREVVVAVSDPHQGAGAAWNNVFMEVRLRRFYSAFLQSSPPQTRL